MVMELKQQEKQSQNIKEYNNRILITGKADCIDKKRFHKDITSYINHLNDDVVFLTLNDRAGPERWIVEWCEKFNYPCIIIEGENETERFLKSGYLPSNILIFSNDNSSFKSLADNARRYKTSVTWVLVDRV